MQATAAELVARTETETEKIAQFALEFDLEKVGDMATDQLKYVLGITIATSDFGFGRISIEAVRELGDCVQPLVLSAAVQATPSARIRCANQRDLGRPAGLRRYTHRWRASRAGPPSGRFSRLVGLLAQVRQEFSGNDATGTAIGLTYLHSLSKRTTVYVSTARMENNSKAKFSLAGATASQSAEGLGTSPKVLSLGMTDSFQATLLLSCRRLRVGGKPATLANANATLPWQIYADFSTSDWLGSFSVIT